MSCYEWERGEITLPTKVFAKFRREFLTCYNGIQQVRLDTLKAWRERALALGKGKRNFNYEQCMVAMTSNYDDEAMVVKLFTDNNKPKMPTRKMFNFVNGTCYSVDVDGNGASISFSKKAHAVQWAVYENNHACDSARDTKEAAVLFGMLRQVQWTRGSGGKIVGNDEYHSESYEAGGGSNYVKETYGNCR